MLPATSALALACLPALLCLALASRPAFFTAPSAIVARGHIELHGKAMVLALLGCLLAIPLALVAFSQGTQLALLAGCAASFAGAMWGAVRLGGAIGALLALAAFAFALVGLGTSSLWAADALSLCAGLGAAHLLHTAFSRRALVWFLAAFALLDIAIVGSGLVHSAIQHFPLVGSFGLSQAHALLFNRVQVGGATLGSGDIAYGALVGALMAASGVSRGKIILICAGYALASVAFAIYATRSGNAVPATVPGVLALGLLALALRRQTRGRGVTAPA